jgi:hypothetical protein
MAKKRVFQIRSKADARYFAEEIRYYGTSFHYYAPLMGVSGGMMTISFDPDHNTCTVLASTSGWQMREDITMPDIVEYLWKERKLINAELRYKETA